MALDTSSALTSTRPAHRLDEDRLLTFLRGVPELARLPGPLTVQQFAHGQSNPTYLLTLGRGPDAKRLVLRKKPPGKLLASAHAVDREYMVLRALAPTAVPVPRPVVLCSNDGVIGTQFYIMEFAGEANGRVVAPGGGWNMLPPPLTPQHTAWSTIGAQWPARGHCKPHMPNPPFHADGTIYTNPNMTDASPSQRAAAYAAVSATLAALHRLDPAAVGLNGFGSPTNYARRQLSRWAVQYMSSVQAPAPRVLQLVGWLQANIPAADADPGMCAIVHGDYRLDNLVFDRTSMQVRVFDRASMQARMVDRSARAVE